MRDFQFHDFPKITILLASQNSFHAIVSTQAQDQTLFRRFMAGQSLKLGLQCISSITVTGNPLFQPSQRNKFP